MTGKNVLVTNHLIANNMNTRVRCNWRTLASIKSAIDEHNEKADAYNKGEPIAEFELLQSALTIAQTLNSLNDQECGDPIGEPPLFVDTHQGGTLVNIHYEIQNADRIIEWLEKTCEGKWTLLANSAVDADISGSGKPVQSADIAVASNKFEFQGMDDWKGSPVMSVRFELEKDADKFHSTWHIK